MWESNPRVHLIVRRSLFYSRRDSNSRPLRHKHNALTNWATGADRPLLDVGFEPTSANTVHLKCTPLDLSGNLAVTVTRSPTSPIFRINFTDYSTYIHVDCLLSLLHYWFCKFSQGKYLISQEKAARFHSIIMFNILNWEMSRIIRNGLYVDLTFQQKSMGAFFVFLSC